jgi:hypothetical protein
MRSTTISAKSSQLCGDKVSLGDHPWMSSYTKCNVWADCELCSDLVLTTFLDSWSGGELDIVSCRYGQLEIAILHLEQIANRVEAPGVQVDIHGAKAEIPSWSCPDYRQLVRRLQVLVQFDVLGHMIRGIALLLFVGRKMPARDQRVDIGGDIDISPDMEGTIFYMVSKDPHV